MSVFALQWSGALLVLVASAAGVIGYFKANVSKTTIELYKQDNEALRARLDTLEHQSVLDATEIRNLKESQAHLLRIVTQAEAIAALRSRVEAIAIKVGA